MSEKTQAIVNSGNRRLVGLVDRDQIKSTGGKGIVVEKAYELRCDLLVLPTPQGIRLDFNNNIVPIDSEESDVDIECLNIDNIRYFDDMVDKGQKYRNMIDAFEERFMAAKAARSGIVVAKNVPAKTTLIK